MASQDINIRINAAIESAGAAKNLKELKTELRNLKDLAAEVGPENAAAFQKITEAAGEVNEKVKDVKESVSALSGTPMEKLGNSFGRLRQSIFELDLGKFKESLTGIKSSFSGLGAQIASPFTNAGQSISGFVKGTNSATVAMQGLGKAIIATGIGALVVSVGLLIAYWDKLSEAGGIVGKIFKSVGDFISGAVESVKEFLVQFGIIGEETLQRNKDLKAQREQRKKDRQEERKAEAEARNEELSDLDKEFRFRQRLAEASRDSKTDSDKARMADLAAEKQYLQNKLNVLESSIETTSELREQRVEVRNEIEIINAKIATAQRNALIKQEEAFLEMKKRRQELSKELKEIDSLATTPEQNLMKDTRTGEGFDPNAGSEFDKAKLDAAQEFNMSRLEIEKEFYDSDIELFEDYVQRKRQGYFYLKDSEFEKNINTTEKIIDFTQQGADAMNNINQILFLADKRRLSENEKDREAAAKADFRRRKALGIVQAVINTAVGITEALKSEDLTQVIARIATTVIAGAASIATIAATKFESTGAANISTTPTAPNVSNTGPQTVTPGQFFQTSDFRAGELQDRRVYVVESDITGVQRRVQTIEQRGKI